MSITKRDIEKVFESRGIRPVPLDDPLYNEPSTVTFMNRSRKSTPGGQVPSEALELENRRLNKILEKETDEAFGITTPKD